MKVFNEIRSEEVQDLLSHPPSWLVRWGITIIFFIITFLFVGSWLIHYPDLVQASCKLTASDPPKAVVSRVEGRLVKLLVKNGEAVTDKTPLCYLESTANHEEVLQLMKTLNIAWKLINDNKLKNLFYLNFVGYKHLGELQLAYQTFEQTRIQLRSYIDNGFFVQKRAMLHQELLDLKLLEDNLKEQQTIQIQDIQLSKEEFDIQLKLLEDKVISRMDFNREKAKFINRQIPYKQNISSLIGNSSNQRAKQKEILELDKLINEEKDKFLQALNTLQSAAESWKSKYILVAPVSGKVLFHSSLQENQTIHTNQDLLYIAPNSTNYIGELFIPQQNSGKVKVGQSVIVKIASFPFQEYGYINGKITMLADIPLRDSVFLAHINFPFGLITSSGNRLLYKNGMTATAEIITDDNRLIQKFFYKLKKATIVR